MDIYAIIKAWYEYKAENNNITSTHTDLLFYILDLNNRLAWKEVFGLPSMETSVFLNISYNTFRKVLADLISIGVIKLVKKSNNQYTANQISIEPLCQNLLKQNKSTYKAFVKAQQKQLKSNCDIDIHIYNNTLLHNNNLLKEVEDLKLEIEKLKSEKPKKEKSNNETLNFISTEFKEIFDRWLNYKAERKEKYKSQDSIKTCYNKLVKYSNNNITLATQIIENAIGNNYAGFFELKNNNLAPQQQLQKPKDNSWMDNAFGEINPDFKRTY